MIGYSNRSSLFSNHAVKSLIIYNTCYSTVI